jgi:hypothetical protein
MQTVSNAAGVAVRVYDKVVHEQIYNKNVLWNNILRNVAKPSETGSTKYMSVHYGRNVGSAAGSETVTLPIAGYQTSVQATITMKKNYQTISLSDFALQASKRSNEFLVNLLDDEYKRARQDMKRQLSRQGYGVGTGVICRVNDASPDTTLTFDTPMTGKHTMRYFDANNAVMFSSAADAATSAAYTTFSAITGDNTATVASATGIADNDYVYLAHTVASGSTPSVSNVNAEVMGLKGLIDDTSNLTTLHNLSRDTYIWWKSPVDSNATQRSLSEELMHDTMQDANELGMVKYGLTHNDVFKAYGQLLSSDRRYTETMTLKGGFTGCAFNTVPLVPDHDCPYDELYWIDPSTLSVEDLAPISFLDEDGSILDRSSTTPVWQATLRYYAQLACSAPNKNAALRDVVK